MVAYNYDHGLYKPFLSVPLPMRRSSAAASLHIAKLRVARPFDASLVRL
jgi:hypothetical protein